MEQESPRQLDRDFVWGLVLILLGAMILLDRLDWTAAGSYWPFLLILLGVVRLVDPPPSGRVARSRRPGAWLLFIGVWGLVNEFGLLGFEYSNSWPLMLVGVGLMFVWRAFEGPDRCDRAAGSNSHGHA